MSRFLLILGYTASVFAIGYCLPTWFSVTPWIYFIKALLTA